MAYTDIDDPTAYFQANLHSGDGGTGQTLTFDGNSDLQLDLHWGKCRSEGGREWQVIDTVRGITKGLTTVTTAAEYTESTYVTAIGSNGYSIGQNNDNNKAGETYVSYNWKEQAGVMDIVTYTGNGSNRTIAHNLGVKPAVMVHKGRSNAYNWGVYHHALSPSNERSLNFNTTGAVNVDDGGVYYNSTDPTSSVFSLGTNVGYNANGATYVAYLFAEKKGYSKFSSYTGNGNADGTFVYTGFKPAFVLIKQTNSGNIWELFDNKRSPSNLVDDYLSPDASDAETTGSSQSLDFLSNGFKPRANASGLNGSGSSYIYMCFAENPFTTSTGVPATAR